MSDKTRVPDVAILISVKDGNLGVNIILKAGMPKELKRALHERLVVRVQRLLKENIVPEPIPPTSFQTYVESNNAHLQLPLPAMDVSNINRDLLREAQLYMEDCLDKGWLTNEQGIWKFDRHGDIIHVDFGRKRVSASGEDT